MKIEIMGNYDSTGRASVLGSIEEVNGGYVYEGDEATMHEIVGHAERCVGTREGNYGFSGNQVAWTGNRPSSSQVISEILSKLAPRVRIVS